MSASVTPTAPVPAPDGATGAPLLRVEGLTAGYGVVPVLQGIDLEVRAGEIVALLGPNGAGKTTTLLTVCGWLRPRSGTVWWLGRPTTSRLAVRAREGLGFLVAERSLIRSISTRDNLRLARGSADRALELFPELRDLWKRRAGLLSGGEQQILGLAAALSRQPKLLVIDEMSLGLAPLVVQRVLSALRRVAEEDGLGVLLVEQHLREALEVSDRSYVMRRGEIVMSGPSSELIRDIAAIEAHYLSAAGDTQDNAGH
jgi:branched-chain amino acid transport system ATP-binding protein